MSRGRARSGGTIPVALVAAIALGTACNRPHQRADDQFRPHVATGDAVRASGANRPARLLFDHAHYNFHRIDGRYKPFADLARSAGFEIKATERRFDYGSFGGADVLVIANATPEAGLPDTQTFSDAELDAIEHFVEGGGGLLLVTDIPPWSLPSARLAGRFGVRLSGGIVMDAGHMNPALPWPPNLIFTRENQLLGTHPILEGKSPAERITNVATFSGQALFPPPDATVLLKLSPSALHTPVETSYVLTKYGTDVITSKAAAERIGGAAQAVALERGAGRVVIMGEAAALTAQVAGPDVRFGMNLGSDNAQLAVNTLRWLARR